MKKINALKSILLLISGIFIFNGSQIAFAETEEEAMAAMQSKLNAEVMEKPFSVEDEKKIDSYIKDAMSKDLKPPQKAPSYWQPGYTCADIYGYGWSAYQNCRYYRHYYGHYW